jgi:hypothetical protein
MGKIQVPKKIRTEDFEPDDQKMADKLGFVYNDNADIVYQTLTKGVDYENLKRQLVTFVVNIDKNGKVAQSPEIKLNLVGRVLGVQVLNAVNINNVNIFPTTAPFVSWNVNSNILRILNITGLQASSQYQLTLDIVF